MQYKYLPLLLLLLEVSCVLCIDKESNNTEDEFKKYLKEFNKTYHTDTAYKKRLNIFKKSLAKIYELNSRRYSDDDAVYGLTRYSDLTEHEFSRLFFQKQSYEHRNANTRMHKNTRKRRSLEKLPEKVDYRLKNLVGSVKDQSGCGSCWAFSTAGLIESMNAIKNGKYEELSVQQLIDCVKFNNGCKGGDVCDALGWQKFTKSKLMSEKEYPTTLLNGSCKYKRSSNSTGVSIKDYTCKYMADREEEILDLLANVGPVSVAVNAYSWQHYLGGTIQYHCNSSVLYLNHAALIVGYDLKATTPHYIVKNSWGETFGNNGYINLAIGKNICGVANQVSTVTIT